MGEIAEAMIEGAMCSWCGVVFEEAHGHPVLCEDCYEGALQEEGKAPDIPKAYHKEV